MHVRIYFMIFFFMLTSCTQKDSKVIVIDPELKKKFSLNEGNQYIYVDSTNNTVDSYFVEKKAFRYFEANGSDQQVEESQLVGIRNGSRYSLIYWTLRGNYLSINFQNATSQVIYEPMLFYPYQQADSYHYANSDNKYTILRVFDSTDIHSVEIYYTDSLHKFNDTITLGERVGILKMYIHHSADTIHMQKAINYRLHLVDKHLK